MNELFHEIQFKIDSSSWEILLYCICEVGLLHIL